MSVRLLSLLLALALSAGCQLTMPPAQPVDDARYGRPIGQYEAERIAKSYLFRAFPSTLVRYHVGNVRMGSRFDPIKKKWHYGYLLRAQAKIKGLLFGDTGELSYIFVMRDGRIVYVYKRWI